MLLEVCCVSVMSSLCSQSRSPNAKDVRRSRAAAQVLKEGYLFKERPPPSLPPGLFSGYGLFLLTLGN